jgi:hypothetical protein
MSFRKNIEPQDVSISSFQVHKTFTFNDTDSGSGFFSSHIIKGTDANLYDFKLNTATSTTISESSYYRVPTYHAINNLYYKDIVGMRGYIDYIRGVPTSSNAVIEYESTNHLENTTITLKRPYTRQLHDTATVISIPQKYYGEYIKPHSVRITDDSTDSTIIIQDDGYGNLYDTAYSASYANRTPTHSPAYSGSVVGNIFYNDGIAVITDTGSYFNTAAKSGSDGFSFRFNSTQTIYEREYVCSVGESEFQHTTNKSLRVDRSGSILMSTGSNPYFSGTAFSGSAQSLENTVYDEFPYHLVGYSTSSYDIVGGYQTDGKLIGQATHSEFATYVTGIGLYNDQNELLAIGKTAKPIKNDKELALTFVVRFDTN